MLCPISLLTSVFQDRTREEILTPVGADAHIGPTRGSVAEIRNIICT